MTEQATCEWCGKNLVSAVSRGRPAKYCSRSHRQEAYELRRVVIALQSDQGKQILSALIAEQLEKSDD